MKLVITLKCKHCEEEIEREIHICEPVCYECKRRRLRAYYKKYYEKHKKK